jgi:hypothetical protein
MADFTDAHHAYSGTFHHSRIAQLPHRNAVTAQHRNPSCLKYPRYSIWHNTGQDQTTDSRLQSASIEDA